MLVRAIDETVLVVLMLFEVVVVVVVEERVLVVKKLLDCWAFGDSGVGSGMDVTGVRMVLAMEFNGDKVMAEMEGITGDKS